MSNSDQKKEVDLSKFFDIDSDSKFHPATIQPPNIDKQNDNKKQKSLIWVVVLNFIIGAAIFSYFIIKTSEESTVKPVTMQKITAPVNYTPGQGERYMPPLP